MFLIIIGDLLQIPQLQGFGFSSLEVGSVNLLLTSSLGDSDAGGAWPAFWLPFALFMHYTTCLVR